MYVKVIGINCPQFAKLNTFPSFVIFINNREGGAEEVNDELEELVSGKL